ncbi:MAG TPA: hypothetical protein VGK04_00170 [Thermoanaerobaculia bacterium]
MSIDIQPAVIISSPIAPVSDDRIRVTRPAMERELLDAVSAAVGLTHRREPLLQAAPAPRRTACARRRR